MDSDTWYIILVIILALIALLIYLIPTFIAFSKGHPYKWIIFVINVFFGATVIGWVGSFIWSVWPSQTTILDPLGDPSGRGIMPEIGKRVGTLKKHASQEERLKALYEMKQKGIISNEEYRKMRKDLIY